MPGLLAIVVVSHKSEQEHLREFRDNRRDVPSQCAYWEKSSFVLQAQLDSLEKVIRMEDALPEAAFVSNTVRRLSKAYSDIDIDYIFESKYSLGVSKQVCKHGAGKIPYKVTNGKKGVGHRSEAGRAPCHFPNGVDEILTTKLSAANISSFKTPTCTFSTSLVGFKLFNCPCSA